MHLLLGVEGARAHLGRRHAGKLGVGVGDAPGASEEPGAPAARMATAKERFG